HWHTPSPFAPGQDIRIRKEIPMPDPRPDAPILFRLQATPLRRAVGTGSLLALGGFMVYLGTAFPPAGLAAKLALPGFGVLILWQATRLWRASAAALVLTEDELREDGGRRLALMDDIETVARGTFAFKPSNGFLLTLRTPGERGWAPGLWWRVGRRIGVGGVISRYPGRQLADMIDQQIAARRAARAVK
ncbi:MAG: hypothetical protein Q7J57_12255, partial [Gemmobacter sp.]|nr:hypothetical protein [Gemmobacter sp.]